MQLSDIPKLPIETLIEIAAHYEAKASQYHAAQLKNECLKVAQLCRDEVAKRNITV